MFLKFSGKKKKTVEIAFSTAVLYRYLEIFGHKRYSYEILAKNNTMISINSFARFYTNERATV